MEGALFSGLQLLVALFLVIMNGVFVTAEFAFTRLRATEVETMVREDKAWAGLVREGTSNLDVLLAVSQVGITIASLGLGALGEPAVANLIHPLLASFLPENLIHAGAFVISFGVITFFHVTYGELASKSIAIAKPQSSARLTAPLMKFFRYLFAPAIWMFNGTANLSVRIFGIPPASETEEEHSEEELHMLVRQSRRQGFLEEREAALADAALELDEKVAREIMVPRPNVRALPATMKLGDLVSATTEGNDIRYPICEAGRASLIVGTVHVKDVLRAAKTHGSLEADVTAGDLMRGVLTIPENKRVDDLLQDLRENGLQMAVVVDEWGSLEGLITLENILEEIVGDIRDEWEEAPETPVRQLPDGSYSVDGSAQLRDVNEALGSNFASEDFNTIGGLVLGRLGRAPEVGDEAVLDGYALRVEEVDGPRVVRVLARKRGEGDGAKK